jgi:hypothetical protein
MRTHVALVLLATASCTVGDVDAVPDGADENSVIHSILSGGLAPLPEFADMPLSGAALMVRTRAGQTRVDVLAIGLSAATAYSAHVHALPCSFAGGGHYKLDPAVETALEENEIWPSFTTDAGGIGRASVTVSHFARGDAMSVVVHDPITTNKMLCADLEPPTESERRGLGTFAAFGAAEAQDQSIAGQVEVVVGAGTELTLEVSGLQAGASYDAHVHALPCEVGDGGGHYKLNPTILDTAEANELWPTIENDAGAAGDTLTSTHAVRADAQSVVIHRVVAPDSKPKVACANLALGGYLPLSADGSAVVLADGMARGYGALAATATLTRTLTGFTDISLSASGLMEGETYTAHLHDLPCGVQNGGAHYKLDPGITDVVETNELWLELVADGSGVAEDSISIEHTARVDGQALVIHDPADGARLACIDVN